MLHCARRGLCEPWCERYATTRHCARCVFLIVKGCEAGGAHVGVPAHGRTRKPGKSLDRVPFRRGEPVRNYLDQTQRRWNL